MNRFSRILLIRVIRFIVKPLVSFRSSRYAKTGTPNRSVSYKSSVGTSLRIDIYEPESASAARLRVHVNIQGSGFCIPNLGSDKAYCRYLANTLGCIVLDVDHSKAPEHQWPAAIDDLTLAVRFVQDQLAMDHGWDTSRLTCSGFSSGGCLALIIAAKPDMRGSIKGVTCFYPSTNLAEDASDKPKVSPRKPGSGGEMPAFFRRFLYNCYLPASQSRSDPLVSPLHFPPDAYTGVSVNIIGCEGDALCREAQQLTEKLKQAGHSDTHFFEVQGGNGHEWDKEAQDGTEAAEWRDRAYAFSAERLRGIHSF